MDSYHTLSIIIDLDGIMTIELTDTMIILRLKCIMMLNVVIM